MATLDDPEVGEALGSDEELGEGDSEGAVVGLSEVADPGGGLGVVLDGEPVTEPVFGPGTADAVPESLGVGMGIAGVVGVGVGVEAGSAGPDGGFGASPLTPGTELAVPGRLLAVPVLVWHAARQAPATKTASRAPVRRSGLVARATGRDYVRVLRWAGRFRRWLAPFAGARNAVRWPSPHRHR